MSILDHLKRPGPDYSRHFIREIDFDNWSSIESYFMLLDQRTPQTAIEWEAWIDDLDELECVLAEEGSRRYIAMTVDTSDEDAGKAFGYFVEEISPKIAPWSDKLQHKIASSEAFEKLPIFFENWRREVRTSIELYREQNITLETEIALEIQAYQKVTGSQTVEFDGCTKSLAQMSPYFEDKNRETRQKAWTAVAERRFQDKDALNQHFDNLFVKRLEIAKNCGFESFIPYIFKAKGRYDYTATDCFNFHDMVEKIVVPLQKKIHRRRAQALGVDKLRPWDTACDPHGRDALKPFSNSLELIQGVQKVFDRMDGSLSKRFRQMDELKLLDLDARTGKAPGGYQCSLDELRLPFIFMNASGTLKDVFTLLHEAGHSFHLFFCRELGLRSYREVPAEIAEVASMSMELFGMKYLDVFFGPEDLKRAQIDHLEDIILLLPWVAAIDAFQHWLYTNPAHTLQERSQKWLELSKKFGGEIDWTGLEHLQEVSWQRQLHLFEVPFYYIEYGFSQIGALGLWKQFREDSERALDHYHAALSLGSSLTLPRLYEMAGLKFDFSAEVVAPMLADLSDLLELHD